MTANLTPNYDAFDELAPEHLETLAAFADDDQRPDYVLGQGTLDSIHLALTHAGVKPGCYFWFGRKTTDPDAPHDCPMRAAIEAMGLHYVEDNSIDTPEEYWGGLLQDEFDEGEVLFRHEYFVTHNKADAEWFKDAEFEDDPYEYNTRIGTALGYHDEAVEAHADPDIPSDTDAVAEFILDTLDEYDPDHLRYRNLAPYLPARTVESVTRSIEHGQLYKDTIDGLAARYETLEPLKTRFDASLHSPEKYEKYLRSLADDSYDCDPEEFDDLSQAARDCLTAFGTRTDQAADYTYTDYDTVLLALTLGTSLPACSFAMGTPREPEVEPLLEPVLTECNLSYRVVSDRCNGQTVRHRYVIGADAEWVNWAADMYEAGDTPDPERFARGKGWPEFALNAFVNGDACLQTAEVFEWVDGGIEYRDDTEVSDDYGELSFVFYPIPDEPDAIEEAQFEGGLIRHECWRLGTVDCLEWIRDTTDRLYPTPKNPV